MAFALGPIPFWQFFDAVGKLSINGYLFTYKATDHNLVKPIYKDIAGSSAFPFPTPMDGTGGVGPIYWNDDEPYYVEFRNGPTTGDQLIWSVDNYVPAGSGGGGSITVNQDLENYVNNGQFRFRFPITASPLPVGPFKVAPDNFYFKKNNTDANDSYDFIELNPSPGVTEPDPNALYYLEYTVSNTPVGESEKVFEYRWPDVRTFQNQEVTVSFMVRGTGSMISNSEITVRQNFGTGGVPSSEVFSAIVAFPVTGDWVKIEKTFTVPSLTGKVIGTDGNDFVAIGLQPSLNTQGSFQFTNFQVQLGEVASTDFTYQSYQDTAADLNLLTLISGTDQLAETLEEKLIPGPGIAITKLTASNVEKLEISSGGASQFEYGESATSTLITGAFTGSGSVPIGACNLIASATITPSATDAILEITGTVQGILTNDATSGIKYVVACIFRSTDTNARGANRTYTFTRFAGGSSDINFQTSGEAFVKLIEVAGTTSPITYELRMTSSAGSTTTINDPSYGGASKAIITVTEHI